MLFDLKRSVSVVGFFFNGVKISLRIDINYYIFSFVYKMFDGKIVFLVVNFDVIYVFRF